MTPPIDPVEETSIEKDATLDLDKMDEAFDTAIRTIQRLEQQLEDARAHVQTAERDLTLEKQANERLSRLCTELEDDNEKLAQRLTLEKQRGEGLRAELEDLQRYVAYVRDRRDELASKTQRGEVYRAALETVVDSSTDVQSNPVTQELLWWKTLDHIRTVAREALRISQGDSE